MGFKFQYLHHQALEIAKKYRQAEAELLDILQKIDDKKVFMHLGYTSLFHYATRALKLSDANASNFITVARKSRAVPELKVAIEAGQITVSKARKLTPVINVENAEHWLSLAQTLPKIQLEREVATKVALDLNLQAPTPPTIARVELRVGVKQDLMKKLRRAQDIISQRSRKPASLEETIDLLVNLFLEKNDADKVGLPVLPDIDAPASVPGTQERSGPLPAEIRRRLRPLGP